jgi:antigen 43
VSNGGVQFVIDPPTPNAATSFTVISSGGAEIVSSGGIAVSTTVDAGGYLILLPGGTASDTISAGGSAVSTGVAVYVPGAGAFYYGSSATDITVGSNHPFATPSTEYVLDGGTAISNTIERSGAQYIFSGGAPSNTTLTGDDFGGGVQYVSTGGSAIATSVTGYDTIEDVYSGGTTTGSLVSSGGLEIVFNKATASGTSVGAGGNESVMGTASGTVVQSGGYENIGVNGIASASFVSSGGYEVISAFGAATSTTVFLGGALDLTSVHYAAGAISAHVDSGTDVLTVTSAGFAVYEQQLEGAYTNEAFSASLDPLTGVGTLLTLENALCFLPGTLIATPDGETPIERLAVGDLVRTASGQDRPIAWIGRGRVLATRGRRNAATPVIVAKGALADNVPHRELRVTKGHSFFFDGALIPVEFLVNHRSIHWDDRAQEVSLYHVELETHDLLLANGAVAESYRDDGNRWLFQNANAGWAQPPKPPCAPVLTGGARVDAVWTALLKRAAPHRSLPLTDEPDLHLLVDGQRVDPAAKAGGASRFELRDTPESVRIVSRAAAPQELGLARDPRSLGVAVRRIVVRCGFRSIEMTAEDPLLTSGFHAYETDNAFRWTDGDAELPGPLFAGLSGPMTVILHCGGSTWYIADDRTRRTG